MLFHRLLRLDLRRATAVALAGLAMAGASRGAIYSCVDAQGRRLTSDRPIPECLTREQRLLNTDGSVRRVMPPSMTADEQAEAEVRERRAIAERMAQQDAVRRDRLLLSRFPDLATHQRAREAALDDVAKSVRFSENRLVELQQERKPLLTEAEFYAGKSLPFKLRQQLDANDAAMAAQRSLVQNQKEEILRIDNLYNQELIRLHRLWAGAPPGSLGSMPAAASSVSPAASSIRKAGGGNRGSKPEPRKIPSS